MRRRLVLVALLLAATSATVAGQSAAPAPAEEEVMRVVTRLFDGMRAGDSAAVRAVFHPSARLVTAGGRSGEPGVTVDSLDKFVRAVGTPHAEVWDERLSNVKVQVDGPLAAVWTDYAFYAGDRFSHCGVDAFQLVRGPEGWQIVALADTRRREGCPGAGK